jgi:hypothetical protein
MTAHTLEYKSGADLLAAFNLTTREQKLEQAVKALMQELNSVHIEHHNQDLDEHLEDENIFCSCADAYRMGHEALK